MAKDFPGAFAALREVLLRHAEGMVVQTDSPTRVIVATPAIAPNKQPFFFGAVMLIKSAVTYHLYPLYFNPALQRSLPAELLARKQGKTCFNFKQPDVELFQMLDAITEQAREHWERHGLLEPGPVSQERLNAVLRAGGEDPAALSQLRKSKGRAAAKKRAATIRKQAEMKSKQRTIAK